MSKLICKHCGRPITETKVRVSWRYCHDTSPKTYSCDGIVSGDEGWKEAKKAEPFIFQDYLNQCEDEVEMC